MAELLVRATDQSQPDLDVDRAVSEKKGDIVRVEANGTSWDDGPPDYVVLRVRMLCRATALDLTQPWWYEPDFNVLQRSQEQDGWRFRIENANAGADGTGAMPPTRVQSRLAGWNAALVRVDPAGPVIDFRVMGGLQATRFWMADVSKVAIEEVAYDPNSGIHRINVRFPRAVPAQAYDRARQVLGIQPKQTAPDTLELDAPRGPVVEAFRSDLRAVSQGIYRLHRFGVPTADVDTAIAAGGAVDVTVAQLEARLIDRRPA